MHDGEVNIYERDSAKYLGIRRMYNQAYLDSELPLIRLRACMHAGVKLL